MSNVKRVAVVAGTFAFAAAAAIVIAPVLNDLAGRRWS